MADRSEATKIGDVNFREFKTEFYVMPKVKEYLEKHDKRISLAVLLPEGWLFYESFLFDKIDEDEDGKPDEKFGTEFITIYTGIVEKRNFVQGETLEETGFNESIAHESEVIGRDEQAIANQDFFVKYIVLKK